MIKERCDFFQDAKFCPILDIHNSLDDQHVQICMNSKFDAFLQPVLTKTRQNLTTPKMSPLILVLGGASVGCRDDRPFSCWTTSIASSHLWLKLFQFAVSRQASFFISLCKQTIVRNQHFF